MFDRRKCAPVEDDNQYSCMDDDIIIDVGKAMNKKMNANINLKGSPCDIHKQICDNLRKMKQKEESGILDLHSIIKELPADKLKRLKESFRPEQPDEWEKNFNTWLTTDDINKVMKQYEVDDKSLKYIGAIPMDFAECEFKNELCNFNLSKYLNDGKTKIAIVFNTDDHDESGEHWISMYIDCKGVNMRKPCIYFFDSVGEKEPEEIAEFVEKVKEQGDKNGIVFTYFCNDIPHQSGSTECGIYSLHFLTYMTEGGNFKNYITNKKSDEYMEKFRNIFFV